MRWKCIIKNGNTKVQFLVQLKIELTFQCAQGIISENIIFILNKINIEQKLSIFVIGFTIL